MLNKSCRDLQQKSIVPTHLPYVVSLVRFYETDSSIYLQLQHAPGGRLWSYVGAYLNQCNDAYYNVEPHRPADDPTSTRTHLRKTDRTGSDTDLSHLPASSDSITASTSVGCAESGHADLKCKLSSDLDSVDESHESINREVSIASSTDCHSQGFGVVLQSSNSSLKYFSIDSTDSSECASRQVSCSSAEDNICHVHLAVMSSGICQFCAKSETPQPATSSDSSTNSPDDTSIYDACHGETPGNSGQTQEADWSTCSAGNSSAVEGSSWQQVDADKSQHFSVRPNSQERSFDSGGRRRRRTLSSAFGELDLAESTCADSTAPPRPIVHLPESCIRQWAAEMVVAISRLHSIGIICWQVHLSFYSFFHFGICITHLHVLYCRLCKIRAIFYLSVLETVVSMSLSHSIDFKMFYIGRPLQTWSNVWKLNTNSKE